AAQFEQRARRRRDAAPALVAQRGEPLWRHANFPAFAVDALVGDVARGDLERRFADFVDEIVGFEANRAFASFEDPHMRARSRRLARL
ncbi:FUSC family protein, partial [Burkholderia multivorans]|uniref:FUSC family protein n=1 Tax=Burkholderia multivorans TaxID=87883 RepID=UPI0021ACD7F8